MKHHLTQTSVEVKKTNQAIIKNSTNANQKSNSPPFLKIFRQVSTVVRVDSVSCYCNTKQLEAAINVEQYSRHGGGGGGGGGQDRGGK